MFAGYTENILAELTNCMKASERENFQDICNLLDYAKQIFISGVGRTGYIMRCFAMRLAQAGYKVYWVGDVNTPRAQSGDLLIIGSGSGETGALKNYVEKARDLDLKILVFTTKKDSSLAMMADKNVYIHASAKYDDCGGKISRQPMGALFEEALFITTEAIILELMEKDQIQEESMQRRHANLE